MKLFGSVVRELRNWLTSFPLVRAAQPYALHLMFGGVGLIFLQNLLLQILPISSYDTIDLLFRQIPLFVIGYYAFFLGAWLTLISKNVKYLPYGLWAYAFYILFPFESYNLTLRPIVSAIIYLVAGYFIFRYAASSASEQNTRGLTL